MTPSEIKIGVLCPLSPPGWVEAGRHLLAGMQQAAADLEAEGGPRFKLVIRDTGANPDTAAAAVEQFGQMAVKAIAGEYHSLAAMRAAGRADVIRIPFVCSSAVIDKLTEQPSEWVARIAPPQSRGWRIYADYLLKAGHLRISVVSAGGPYWRCGTGILHDHLRAHGGGLVPIDVRSLASASLSERIIASGSTCVLLLVGYPEPLIGFVEMIREDERLEHVLIGAPAGQPEFSDWLERLRHKGASVPFLQYRQKSATPLAEWVERTLRTKIGRRPSFVALEGYDAIKTLAGLFASGSALPRGHPPRWDELSVAGTRGALTFSRQEGEGAWQWREAPIQVAERDPRAPAEVRVLADGV